METEWPFVSDLSPESPKEAVGRIRVIIMLKHLYVDMKFMVKFRKLPL